NALVQPQSRAALRRILEQGWLDAIRSLHPDDPMYTFWDYLRNRWPRDAGLRLDLLLLSPAAAERLGAAGGDRPLRGEANASDPAPAWVELRDAAARRTAARPATKSTPKPRKQPTTRAPEPDVPQRPLLVIDGDSFAHRSYHALPKTILARGGKGGGA